ncbi:ArsR/SmtB family transcription factor [Halovenus marina]|uniref:ArsR/SmtB family transcription factor n=1 Tax=Halovenus marina TaxID=3396621 RepID=UPI003F55BE3E
MPTSEQLAALSEVVGALEDAGVDVEPIRDVQTLQTGDVEATVELVIPEDVDEGVPGSIYPPETLDDQDEADPEPEDTNEQGDQAESENPYEPVDFGHYDTVDVTEGSHRTGAQFNVPSIVCDYFDTERVHFREREGRVEIAPGPGPDDCMDYQADNSACPQNQQVVGEMLDVVPGDEIEYSPDGDVVVVEPNRIVERDDPSTLLLDEENFPPTAWEIVETLDLEGELPVTELETLTERAENTIHIHLSNLQEDGIVEKRQDPDDGRRCLYSLAEAAYDGEDDELDKERKQLEAVFG